MCCPKVMVLQWHPQQSVCTQDQLGCWQMLTPAQHTKHKKGFNIIILCTQNKWLIQCEYIYEHWFMSQQKLDGISHIVIQHFFSFQCLDPLHGYELLPYKQEKEHRLRHTHTTHNICMWVSHFIVEVPNPSAWPCRPGPFTLYKLLTSTSVVLQFHRQKLLPWDSTQNTITHANTLY